MKGRQKITRLREVGKDFVRRHKAQQTNTETPVLNDMAIDEQKDAGLDQGNRSRRAIYLLPNIITSAALFAGFYAIVAAMQGNIQASVFAIFIAMALDTADGRVARITQTESEFGAEFDSLSDMVAFGVAPALVVFSSGVGDLGQIGWVVTFIYMACAALRLARFNTHSDDTHFTGLASPAAAGLLTSAVWLLSSSSGAMPLSVALSLALLTACVGLLMVSNFVYYSPKRINLRERIPFLSLVLVTLGFAILLVDPPLVLLLIGVAYAASAPTRAMAKLISKKINKPTA